MSTRQVYVSLEIHRGSHVGQSVAVTHSPFRVGKGRDSDWHLADDLLGWKHFEIQIADKEVRVHGLLSDGPVYLNGERVIGHVLSHDDLILAGETEIRVRIAEPAPEIPPAPAAAPALPIVQAPPLVVEELGLYHLGEDATRRPFAEDPRPIFAAPPLENLGVTSFSASPGFQPAHKGRMFYALVDSTQDFPWAFSAMREGYDLVSLFLGDLSRELIDVAPYFFSVRSGAPLLKTWSAAQGKNLGILIDSPAQPLDLFRHLREIFVARDAQGQEYFFRYYDPRVLRAFLPSCNPDELAEFFGPMQGLIVENESAPGYVLYRRDDAGMLEQVPLGTMEFASRVAAPEPAEASA